jgi:hypothetical protein
MEKHESDTPEGVPVGRRRIKRRTLLQVAAGGLAVVAGAAVYRDLALISPPPKRTYGPPPGGYPAGQFQVADYGVRTVADAQSGVPIDVPPVWNLVLTARLARPPSLRDRQRLEAALQAVEAAYPYAPSGVFVLVGYGLPYFNAYIPPGIFAAHLPRMADVPEVGNAAGAPVLIGAVRFASDPPSLLLEQNEVVFHLRSDSLDILHDVQRALFERSGHLADQPAPSADVSDLFILTSVRTGFVGPGLPRSMALQAKLPYAAQIPAQAPLFMGFTSTQQQGQAKEIAVTFEGKRDPLLEPLTTARPGDYFAGGTSLHLSHLVEHLESWYALSYEERTARMFHYNAATQPGRVTINTFWLNPNPTSLDAQRNRVMGHNEAIQLGSRSQEGQALQLRADFNTMDSFGAEASMPGVHFLAFTAGSPIFHRGRQAMDAVELASQYAIPSSANGINAFIHATRRQNFLVPPRRHRAFPLVELLPR